MWSFSGSFKQLLTVFFFSAKTKNTPTTCHVPIEDYNTVKGTYLLLNGEAREAFVVESQARVQSIGEVSDVL